MMIEIKILGIGCGKCRLLESMVYKALELMNVHDASVELVADQMELEYRLLGDSPPGLIIDGNLF